MNHNRDLEYFIKQGRIVGTPEALQHLLDVVPEHRPGGRRTSVQFPDDLFCNPPRNAKDVYYAGLRGGYLFFGWKDPNSGEVRVLAGCHDYLMEKAQYGDNWSMPDESLELVAKIAAWAENPVATLAAQKAEVDKRLEEERIAARLEEERITSEKIVLDAVAEFHGPTVHRMFMNWAKLEKGIQFESVGGR